jgi:hypothetical protein
MLLFSNVIGFSGETISDNGNITLTLSVAKGDAVIKPPFNRNN